MTVEELNVIITANNNDFNRKLDAVNVKLAEMKRSAHTSSASTLSSFKTLARGITALGIGKLITSSIREGMDAIESDSLFETSLGKYAEETRKWSQELSGSLGLNAVSTRKNVGVLYTMTQSMGIAGDTALKMSKTFTLLSGDMASFYNMSEEEAFTKLRAGLTGETEPLKRLGILVDENTVKQYAYANGIAAVGTELSQQQKVLARYGTILQQTATAQGDLARTIDSPANQLRILQNEILNSKQEIGAAFMPLVKEILPQLTAGVRSVTPVITGFISGFTKAAQVISSMNGPTKIFLVSLASYAIVGPAATFAVEALILSKQKLSTVLSILTFKQRGFAGALQSTVAWLTIASGAIALISSLLQQNEQDEAMEKYNEDYKQYMKDCEEYYKNLYGNMSESGNAVNDLTSETEALAKAQKQLTPFDELNKLSSGKVSAIGSLFDSDLGLGNDEDPPEPPEMPEINNKLSFLSWLPLILNLLSRFMIEWKKRTPPKPPKSPKSPKSPNSPNSPTPPTSPTSPAASEATEETQTQENEDSKTTKVEVTNLQYEALADNLGLPLENPLSVLISGFDLAGDLTTHREKLTEWLSTWLPLTAEGDVAVGIPGLDLNDSLNKHREALLKVYLPALALAASSVILAIPVFNLASELQKNLNNLLKGLGTQFPINGTIPVSLPDYVRQALSKAFPDLTIGEMYQPPVTAYSFNESTTASGAPANAQGASNPEFEVDANGRPIVYKSWENKSQSDWTFGEHLGAYLSDVEQAASKDLTLLIDDPLGFAKAVSKDPVVSSAVNAAAASAVASGVGAGVGALTKTASAVNSMAKASSALNSLGKASNAANYIHKTSGAVNSINKASRAVNSLGKAAGVAAAGGLTDINSSVLEQLDKKGYKLATYENITSPSANRYNASDYLSGNSKKDNKTVSLLDLKEALSPFRNSAEAADINVTVEIDGDKVGEAAVHYQNRQLKRFNGRGS